MQMYNNLKENLQKGFTLIELSIVMVIIGLVIGGVLVGQDLIRGAEVRSLISQIDKYGSGINAFRLKYNALPGDFNQSSTYILSTATNGNGNGLIGSVAGGSNVYTMPGSTPTISATAVPAELVEFWRQLSLLNLIEGSFNGTVASIAIGTNFPATKTNKGGILAFGNTGDSVNYFHLGLNSATTGNATFVNALSPDDARNIDAKMDDGIANSGIVSARGGLETNPTFSATLGAASTGCVVGTAATFNSTAAATYNTSVGTSLNCQLRIRLN
jgi:prepilin-type N-terminal cleavage/methylation domain-containing protein